MTDFPNILANGIPPGVIFGAIVFALWSLTAILGKKDPKLSRPTGTMTDLAEVRRRVLAEQALGKRVAQEQVVAQRERARQQKSSPRPRKQKAVPPPPLPTRAAALPSPPRSIPKSDPPPPRLAQADVSTAMRGRPSETLRNVRLLLQRNAAAEGFVLGEIFGPPKGMRDSSLPD